jgi:hypothetical protein
VSDEQDPDDSDDWDELDEDQPYLSQISLIAAIMKFIDSTGLKLINQRQTNAIIEGANVIMDALGKPHVPATPGMGITAWGQCDDTGQSSRFMAGVLIRAAGSVAQLPFQELYRDGQPYNPHPHDPSDFGRCVQMLDAEPKLRGWITAMASHGTGDVWPKLVPVWSELEALYREEFPSGTCPKLYDRMKEIGC